MKERLEEMKEILQYEQDIANLNTLKRELNKEIGRLLHQKDELMPNSKLIPLKEREIAKKQQELKKLKARISQKQQQSTRREKALKETMKKALEDEMDLYRYEDEMREINRQIEEAKARIPEEKARFATDRARFTQEVKKYQELKRQVEQRVNAGDESAKAQLNNVMGNMEYYQKRIDEMDGKIKNISDEVEELSRYITLEDHVEEYAELEDRYRQITENFDLAREIKAMEEQQKPERSDSWLAKVSEVKSRYSAMSEEAYKKLFQMEIPKGIDPKTNSVDELTEEELDIILAKITEAEIEASLGTKPEELPPTESPVHSDSWYAKWDEVNARLNEMSYEAYEKLVLQGEKVSIDELTEEELDIILAKIDETEKEVSLGTKPSGLTPEEIDDLLGDLDERLENKRAELQDKISRMSAKSYLHLENSLPKAIMDKFVNINQMTEQELDSVLSEMEDIPALDPDSREAYDYLLQKSQTKKNGDNLPLPKENAIAKWFGNTWMNLSSSRFVKFVKGMFGRLANTRIGKFFSEVFKEENELLEEEEIEFKEEQEDKKSIKAKRQEEKDKKKAAKDRRKAEKKERKRTAKMVIKRDFCDIGFEQRWNTGKLTAPASIINEKGEKVWVIPGEKEMIPFEEGIIPEKAKKIREEGGNRRNNFEERVRSEETAAKVGSKEYIDKLCGEEEEIDYSKMWNKDDIRVKGRDDR